MTVRGSAFATLALAGWVADGTPQRVALWVVAGVAALLLHELAHAGLARRWGAVPFIEVTWSGGLTRWHPPQRLSPLRGAAVLLAGPVTGAMGAGLALWAAATIAPTTALLVLAVEVLELFAAVSLVLAALDLLPVFPRDGSRLLLLALREQSVRQVVRAASVGAVVAAAAAGALLVSPWPRLAVVPAVLLVTNAWLALRGDRAIGRPVPEAIDAHDWASVRRRILAGCDAPEVAARAQERALAVSAFAEAADIGDAALARGWRTIGFARRTATARAFLEQDDLAVARVRDAVAYGADPDELAAAPMLGHLTYRLDWPSSPRRRPSDDFSIDLRDRPRGDLHAWHGYSDTDQHLVEGLAREPRNLGTSGQGREPRMVQRAQQEAQGDPD